MGWGGEEAEGGGVGGGGWGRGGSYTQENQRKEGQTGCTGVGCGVGGRQDEQELSARELSVGRPQRLGSCPLVALGTYLHRPARSVRAPGPVMLPKICLLFRPGSHCGGFQGGRLANQWMAQPWPNPLLHWKANPVNPLDRSSG